MHILRSLQLAAALGASLLLQAGQAGRRPPRRLAGMPAGPPQPIPGWQLMRVSLQNMQPFFIAMESYNTDNNSYPPVDTLTEALTILTPDYLPADYAPIDGWGRSFRFATLRPTPGGPAARYRLASAGEDGVWRYPSLWFYQPYWMLSPLEDLVLENGGVLTRFSDPDESGHDRYFRTASRIKVFTSALESFSTDNNGFPEGDSFEEAYSRLTPDYFQPSSDAFLSLDEWRHALRYAAWSDNPAGGAPEHYCVGSSADDRLWEHPDLRQYVYRDVRGYGDDIIRCDGAWLQLVDDPDKTPMQRYRESLGTIKTIATSVEMYNVDNNTYPADTTIDALLNRLISEGYLSGNAQALRLDGWRVPLRYQPKGCAGQICPEYRFGSAAADQLWEFPDLLPYLPGDNTTLSQDIILEDGQWIRACPGDCPVSSPPVVRPSPVHPPGSADFTKH